MCPALQRQEFKRLSPLPDSELSGQALQAAEPELGLYVPGAHSPQVWPSGPVAPALHRQSN